MEQEFEHGIDEETRPENWNDVVSGFFSLIWWNIVDFFTLRWLKK